MKKCAVILLVLLTVSGMVRAEELESGLEVGDFPGAFDVLDITGPNRGRSLCYRCAYGNKPVVAIFTREINNDIALLIQQIDRAVGENRDQKMSAFVVLLSDDPVGGEKSLKNVAKEKQVQYVPLTTYQDSEGPPEYNISDKAALSVIMWVKSKVTVNRAFNGAQPNAETRKAIVAATKTILDDTQRTDEGSPPND